MKRTPTLTFHYDESVERGDADLSPPRSMTEATELVSTELEQVADEIRRG